MLRFGPQQRQALVGAHLDSRSTKTCDSKNIAKGVLATLSRADPAFELYDSLLKDAQYAISSKRQRDSHLFEEGE